MAVSLPVIVQTASAQVPFSDNYTVGANSGGPNTALTNPGRQGGSLAPLIYIVNGNVQVGNTGTLPIDPGDASSGDSLLVAFGSSTYINYDFSIVTGPLEIDFKGLASSIASSGDQSDWVSFNVGNGAGAPFVNNSAVSSILFRANGGTELWNQGGSPTDLTGAFAPGYNNWTSYKVILSDTPGTGSAFVGNGTRADYYSNGSYIGTFNMNQLGAGQGYIGFSGGNIVGYDNVTISGTLPAIIAPVLQTDIEPLRSEGTTGQSWTLSVDVTGAPLNYQWYNQSGAIGGATTNSYSFNAVAGTSSYYVIITNSAGSVTSSIASVISAANIVTVNNYSFENGGTPYYGNGEVPTGWSPFNAGGNWAGLGTSGGGFDAPDGNSYLAINTVPASSGPSGVYQDVGALLPNTTYTLTVAIGRSTAAGVPAPNTPGDWSPGIIALLNGTDSTGALLATTTGYPSVVGTWQDYTATFSTGSAPSGHIVVTLSDAPANTYQATFDNVRLTSAVSSAPSPVLLTNTTPASATVGSGSNVVFTAAFSNSPPVSLQWQQVISGSPNVTNNINTGVVNVTASGVVTSTLTLANVQLTNAGSYQLEAANATNLTTIIYTSAASLTVIPTITWYAAGTYNSTFSDDSVLALAGSTNNEVYGVDFGGSGSQTTLNGYTFSDNVASGNMTVANSPTSYGGYLAGGATTDDPALDTMLAFGVYGNSGNTGTLNKLNIGQTYTVLVLLDDTRGAAAGGSVFHVIDGETVSPGQQYAFANGVPKVGGYIMGTFTAQATTQPLTILNVLAGASQYNLVLLETGIAPPPPIAPTLTSDVSPLYSEVPVGAPMTFSVSATGSIPLSYKWSNQNGLIGSATNASYSFNALPGTNSYSVVITNAYGSISSSTAVVIGETNAPPVIGLNNTDWALNDNGSIIPSINSGLLTLTDGNGSEASSTFYDVGQYIGGFIASFTYQTSGGADGITFCMQDSPAGTNAVGGAGGAFGYQGITPSVAFEMNIFTGSAYGGIGIRVATNGTSSQGLVSTAPVNIASGDSIYVQLYYSQGVMQVLMADPTASTSFTTNYTVNVPAVVGNGSAYIGLTGADGGITSTQTVTNFLYSYTTPPILSIAPSAPGYVVVSWPVSVSSLFTLEQSASLTGPWLPAAGATNQVNLQNQVTLPTSGSASYYQLKLNDPNAP